MVDFAFAAWRATPEMRIEDAYKWLFQATRGGEHAAPDPAAARDRLAREWAGLPAAAPDVPLIEWLDPARTFARVHLAAARARGLSAVDVADAFVTGASRGPTPPAAFLEVWNQFGQQLRHGDVGALSAAAWRELDAVSRPHGYPAVHHSDAYRSAYRPAYRVVPHPDALALTGA